MPATDGVALAFDKAVTLHRQGRLDAAIEGYEAILADHPEHIRALCCLCLCRLDRGQGDLSLRLAHRATTLAAESAEAWHCLGSVQTLSGDNRAAADSFLKMLTIQPTFAEGYNNLGKTLIALHRPDTAQRCFRAALILKPDFVDAQYNLGNVLVSLRHPQDAAVCFARTAFCAPYFAEALNSLGAVFLLLKQTGPAIDAIERALAVEPGSAPILTNLGNALEQAKQPGNAITCHERALRLNPANADAHYGLANGLVALKRYCEAIGCYAQALAFRPDFAEAFNNLGSALQALDRAEEALTCYHKAITLTPDDAEAHYNLGLCLTETGHLDDAYRAFERAIALAPARVSFYRMLAETKRIDASDPHVRRMEDLAQDMAVFPDSERMELHFALGKVYGDCGQHEQSFHHLLAGNQLKRRGIAYSEPATLAVFDRIRTVFTAERLATGPEIGFSSRHPVFIVGMPRSGTTLVEQILASHPGVFGAGEVQDLQHLVNTLAPVDGIAAFPEIVAVLAPETVRRLGAAYVAGLRARAPDAERIVDKMLANFKRIGLIHLALPDARIIHVRRDPVDTCLACFSKLFASSQPFAYDLAELGRYYRAYKALMAHWRLVLPPGVMLDVLYEDVVADMEGQARRLLAHCGLDWDDRCLAFHQTQRLVRTASAAQVRQPLYRTSVGRWRAYGELARPLLDALGDLGEASPSWPDS
ncbi:MAG TPA: sulfotransferase [Telmatospirillum sp.]|nr:sulfotransferase [Telmatospirillum sp.]